MTLFPLHCHSLRTPSHRSAFLATCMTDDRHPQITVVVIDEHNHWSGFRPCCLEATAAALGATA